MLEYHSVAAIIIFFCFLLLPFHLWLLQWIVCEDLPLTTSFICFFKAPLGSLISNHVSCQVGIMLGGLLASTGLILSSFATSLEHLYLSLGILTGRMHSAPLLLLEHKTGILKMMADLFSMSYWHCTGQIRYSDLFPSLQKTGFGCPSESFSTDWSHKVQVQHPAKATLTFY